MNKRFQEYKKCEVVFVDHLDLGFKINAFVFTPEDLEKSKKKEKYNRAKEKREFERRVEEEWEK